MKQNYLRAIALLFFYLVGWVIPLAKGQKLYYQPQQFDLSVPVIEGTLGELYNPQPYQLLDAPTYYGKQNIYATAYLPFIETEYNAAKSVELFGPNYTTGIALCSPKDPSLGLFAPVQVIAAEPNPGGFLSSLASVIPYDENRYNYKGPYNSMPSLNYQQVGFVSPVKDKYGLSILKEAQDFTTFSHTFLKDANEVSWNGFDKAGNIPISCLIDPSQGGGSIHSSELDAIIFKQNYGTVFRVTIGHEITHGIIAHSNGYNEALRSQRKKELDEGFGNIIGYAYKLWKSTGNLSNPDWDYFSEIYPGTQPMNKPKSNLQPNTYGGQFYVENVKSPGYELHNNGAIEQFVFTLVSDGGTGLKDDDPFGDSYDVSSLIPNDPEGSFQLALRIWLIAFTEKLTNTATYPDLREATLQAVIDLGHPEGSNAFVQLQKAWTAASVEMPIYNKDCVEKTAESLFNGMVTFNAQEGTLFPDPQGQKVSSLVDCSNANLVKTMFNEASAYTDWNNNQLYSNQADETKSQIAVSVHAFTQVARDWFNSKFGYNFNVINKLCDVPEDKDVTLTEGIVSQGHVAYPYEAVSACRDRISKNYFRVIDRLKTSPYLVVLPPMWETITGSLGEIFALEIKRDYEKERQNPDADHIWTLYEDLSDPSLTRDLSNPKFYGQPTAYQGALWDDSKPANNTGFMNLCYYLLVHGTVNDVTNTDEGYTNNEPGSLTYFINKVDRDVVLNAFLTGYQESKVKSSIEEFRLATMDALHAQGFDAKSKEHIAFYDAWAAVLALPDYASTLKHYPEDGAVIHPWMAIDGVPGMFGVEVEYITYESSRLFEVSKSATFNENEAPVYRFLNKTAPDFVTGMTYADVYLEPGQTYYVHSRLSNTGDPHLGCAETPDPAFCESLKGKKKWTVTYKIHTSEVGPVEVQNPKAGETIAAWASPFSWMSKAGAAGYGLQISGGGIADILVGHDEFYDEDNAQVPVEAVLALSKLQNYSWSVAARRRTGSPWAVHVWPNGMTYPFTDDEKEALPYAYGNWGEVRNFKTDLPTLTPGAYPAHGEHVPLIGAPIILTSSSIANAGNNYNFEYKEPYKLFLNTGQPAFSMHVSNIPGIVDQQAVEWAFTPVKAATAPFILAEEKGATVWRTFVADLSLSAKPELEPVKCFSPSAAISKWSAVADAQGYKYSFKEAGTNQEVASGITDQLASPIITTAGGFPNPGKYIRTVSAGVKNSNNVWLFGPEASDTYGVRPPAPINLTPVGGTVTLGDNHSVTFNWANGPLTNISNEHIFNMEKLVNGNQLMPDFSFLHVMGNQFVAQGLEFNTEYFWSIRNISDLTSCSSESASGTFKTGDNPVSPELRMDFQYVVKNDLALPVDGIRYNITVLDPNGNIVFDKIQQHANIPVGGILPIVDGQYHINVRIVEIEEGVKQFKDDPAFAIVIETWDKGAANQQLDIDGTFGEVAPVLNTELHFTFVYNTSDNTINQFTQQ
jgi:hypothetical protein